MKATLLMSRLILVITLVSAAVTQAAELHDAARNGDLEQVRALISGGIAVDTLDSGGNTALYWATAGGHVSVVELLLASGANVNAVSTEGDRWTPLIIAAYRGRRDVVRLLLDSGADMDVKDVDGYTALSWAFKEDRTKIVRLLIERGAGTDVLEVSSGPRKHKIQVLQYAASRGDEELVRLLISRGADISARDAFGNTALHTAAGKGYLHIARLLLEHGADVNAATKGVRISAPGMQIQMNNYTTPLHSAVSQARLEMVKLLIRHRARLDATCSGSLYTAKGYLNYSNLTPLQLAELYAKYPPDPDADYRSVIKYLRDYLRTGGSTSAVSKAIHAFAALLDEAGRKTEALHASENAGKFDAAMQTTESTYLGFDPSALLDEYAALLRERGLEQQATAANDLAAWWFHANLAGARTMMKQSRQRQEDEEVSPEDY